MTTDLKQLEIDRVVNLAKSFEFEIISSSIQEDRILITAEKIMPQTKVDQMRFESERMATVLRSTGWTQRRLSIGADRVTADFEKEVKTGP